jgi:hypothetical protein
MAGQFTGNPVHGKSGFGIRIKVLCWFSVGDLGFVLLCENGLYQSIEHATSEGCDDNSGNLESGAVEVS